MMSAKVSAKGIIGGKNRYAYALLEYSLGYYQ